MRIALVILIGALFFSCSKPKVPAGIIPPEKMQAVFWDYLRADIYANEFIRKDSGRNVEMENAKLQQQVFMLHKTSREEFYKSYEYYLNHQGQMKLMLDTLLVRQQKIIDAKKDTSYKKWANKKYFLKY